MFQLGSPTAVRRKRRACWPGMVAGAPSSLSGLKFDLHACSCTLGCSVVCKFLQDVLHFSSSFPSSEPGWRRTGIEVLNHQQVASHNWNLRRPAKSTESSWILFQGFQRCLNLLTFFNKTAHGVVPLIAGQCIGRRGKEKQSNYANNDTNHVCIRAEFALIRNLVRGLSSKKIPAAFRSFPETIEATHGASVTQCLTFNTSLGSGFGLCVEGRQGLAGSAGQGARGPVEPARRPSGAGRNGACCSRAGAPGRNRDYGSISVHLSGSMKSSGRIPRSTMPLPAMAGFGRRARPALRVTRWPPGGRHLMELIPLSSRPRSARPLPGPRLC